MKAIATQKICLKCHGDTIPPEVTKQLDSLYPYDQVTGFSVEVTSLVHLASARS